MKKDQIILLVDDDERLNTAAGKVLMNEGYRVVGTGCGQDALQRLSRKDVVLVISDLRLPDMDGNFLLKEARTRRPDIEVVMITGHGSVESAVEALKLGAYDYIQKPLDSAALLKVVAKALEKQRLASENQRLRLELRQRRGIESLLGASPGIEAVKRLIRQIAPTEVCVLIQGESGTGKEVVADALHDLSSRCEGPLVKISCAAIPENLLESELFGYERGAFTGAATGKPGKLELADGGTLLLDEIAEMTPALQAKLLRVLQDGSFQRVGGTRDIQGDFRLLCATHADIPRAIDEKRFRQDLYYRINTVQITLPPLRARLEDVPLLAASFLGTYSSQMNKGVRHVTAQAQQQLLTHSWPGNVRELEHVVQCAVALAEGDSVASFAFAPAAAESSQQELDADGQSISIPLGITVSDATQRLVEATIEHCAGNKLQAARILGIPARTMYRHFSKLSS